jgi:hypothetical protein
LIHAASLELPGVTLKQFWSESSWLIRSWLTAALVALLVQTLTVVAPQIIGRYDWLFLLTLPLLILGATTVIQGRQAFRHLAMLPARRVWAPPIPSAETPAVIRYGMLLALACVIAAIWWSWHTYPHGAVVQSEAGIYWVDGDQARPATVAELHEYNAASLRMVASVWLVLSLFNVWLLHRFFHRYEFRLTESQRSRL